MPAKTWSKKQLSDLKRLWPTIPNPRDLEPIIGKSYEAMKSKATVLKLYRKVSPPGVNTDSPEAIKYLQENYLTTSVNQMSRALERSETYVNGAMKRYGLIQPKELIERFKQESRIKPGTIPINKGKKQTDYMSPDAIERTKATRFTKGRRNFNELHDGAIQIRIDKSGRDYKWIRISKAKWKTLHVFNWENVHGPVPKGHIVVFKNKHDRTDCSVEKLELITLKENMIRNSASKNLTDAYVANCIAWHDKETAKEMLNHPEIIEVKRQQIILNRTIYEQQQKRVS
jgi:hypothetical protein